MQTNNNNVFPLVLKDFYACRDCTIKEVENTPWQRSTAPTNERLPCRLHTDSWAHNARETDYKSPGHSCTHLKTHLEVSRSKDGVRDIAGLGFGLICRACTCELHVASLRRWVRYIGGELDTKSQRHVHQSSFLFIT